MRRERLVVAVVGALLAVAVLILWLTLALRVQDLKAQLRVERTEKNAYIRSMHDCVERLSQCAKTCNTKPPASAAPLGDFPPWYGQPAKGSGRDWTESGSAHAR